MLLVLFPFSACEGLRHWTEIETLARAVYVGSQSNLTLACSLIAKYQSLLTDAFEKRVPSYYCR